jgi:hypothetical protein
VLTKAQIINIWKSYITTGYFQPTAGVQWDNAQIVAYLTSTMI